MQANFEKMDKRICGDLCKYFEFFISVVEKNRRLDELYPTQTLDNQIQIRIEQLAVAKILVNIHRHDLFILVKPYTQLGEAYLNNKYYE